MSQKTKTRVAVLGSTNGSALQPIIDAIECGDLNAEIVAVISNRSKSGIIERARNHNLNAFFVGAKNKERSEYDEDVSRILRDKKIDIILCIGYMRIFSESFVKEWYGKNTNVHPSLLPKHPGLMDLAVHQAAIDAGDSESGCTIHLIDEGVDSGPVLIQEKVKILPNETAESLKAKVQPLEGLAFIEVIRNWPMKAVPQAEI